MNLHCSWCQRKKIHLFQYQFIFNGDFKQINSSLLTSILIMFIYLGWEKVTITLYQFCRHLILTSVFFLFLFFLLQTLILWYGLQPTGSPSLQARNLTCEYNKSIPTYINLILVVVSSTHFLLIGMHRSQLDNSRTSHHQSLVL